MSEATAMIRLISFMSSSIRWWECPAATGSFLSRRYFQAKLRYRIPRIFKAFFDIFPYIAFSFDKFAGDLAPLFDGLGCTRLQLSAADALISFSRKDAWAF
jgi:hypothetical protein